MSNYRNSNSAGESYALKVYAVTPCILILIVALWLCAALLLNGCAPHKAAPSPKAGIFPVVIPFAVDRAGTKLALEFEVPYALYPDAPKPLLRSVFIGVRRVEDKEGGRKELQEWTRRNDYLQKEPVPVRLKLDRWEHGQWTPAAMREQHREIQPGPDRYWYEPVSDDGVVPGIDYTDPDHMALEAIGQRQKDKAYVTYEFVRISPPTPGRYRLEVESLQDHPSIRGLVFELIVSHHFLYK